MLSKLKQGFIEFLQGSEQSSTPWPHFGLKYPIATSFQSWISSRIREQTNQVWYLRSPVSAMDSLTFFLPSCRHLCRVFCRVFLVTYFGDVFGDFFVDFSWRLFLATFLATFFLLFYGLVCRLFVDFLIKIFFIFFVFFHGSTLNLRQIKRILETKGLGRRRRNHSD